MNRQIFSKFVAISKSSQIFVGGPAIFCLDVFSRGSIFRFPARVFEVWTADLSGLAKVESGQILPFSFDMRECWKLSGSR